jgi:hypothetical protein
MKKGGSKPGGGSGSRGRVVDGEADRVAAACDELVGAERRLDPRPAATAVLLLLVTDDVEGPLHHVDLIGLLELACHWFEIAATRGRPSARSGGAWCSRPSGRAAG